MGFTSQLFPGEPIIDDDMSSDHVVVSPNGLGRGLDLSRRGPGEHEYGAAADPFPKELLIPRHEWQARIEEMEEQKSRLSDIIQLAGLPPKDQKNLNYCWIFAPVHCLEIVRVQQNQPMVDLSPASAGAQIKGFRNVGGWGKEGLEWIAKHGVCPSSKWPATSLDRRYLTAENKAAALDYRVDEWTELIPRNLDQQISLLLRRVPIAIGQNHWQHEVACVDAIWLEGEIATRIRNQWSGWGVNGFGIQRGSKMLADDAVAPRTALAT